MTSKYVIPKLGNNYVFGKEIIIFNSITYEFTKIDKIITENNNECYYFDPFAMFKLKYNKSPTRSLTKETKDLPSSRTMMDNKSLTNVVEDGYYKIKTNSDYFMKDKNWNNKNYRMYYVKNGKLDHYGPKGYYIDTKSNCITSVSIDGITSDIIDHIYLNWDNRLFSCQYNIYEEVKDGHYEISNFRKRTGIYEKKGNTLTIYMDWYINLHTLSIYYHNKFYGLCDNGTFLNNDGNLILLLNNKWKTIKLDSFAVGGVGE